MLRVVPAALGLVALVLAIVALVVPWASFDYFGTSNEIHATGLALNDGNQAPRYSWFEPGLDNRDGINQIRVGHVAFLVTVGLGAISFVGAENGLLGHRFGHWVAAGAGLLGAASGATSAYQLGSGAWAYCRGVFGPNSSVPYELNWQAGFTLAIITSTVLLVTGLVSLTAAIRQRRFDSPFPAQIA